MYSDPPRKPYQFSLRSLLLVVTGAVVFCSLLVTPHPGLTFLGNLMTLALIAVGLFTLGIIVYWCGSLIEHLISACRTSRFFRRSR